MIDQLDVALRRYEEIRPADSDDASHEKAQEISLWLETQVCAVVEELATRPDFQAHVCWPIRELRKGSGTPERLLVEAVDTALVASAQELVKLARRPHVFQGLLRLGPHDERLPEGDPKGCDPIVLRKTGVAVPLGFPAVELIGRRPWRDLVNINDYFSAASNLNLIDRKQVFGAGSRHVQIADFVPFTNPRLRPLGDFVSRTLLIRIEYWTRVLRRFLVRCQTARSTSKNNDASQWVAFNSAQEQLNHEYERLKEECLTGAAARLRNSCIALFQIYWEYRPSAPLQWLGLRSDLRNYSANVRHRIESQMEYSIGEQVAAGLMAVARIHRAELDHEAAIETACRSYLLVVVMGVGRREVYWRGACLNVDWSARNVLWELLEVLAERGKAKQGADAFEFPATKGLKLKDRRHELKKVLPSDLDHKIQPAGRGTYRLTLQPEEICVLKYAETQHFEEVL